MQDPQTRSVPATVQQPLRAAPQRSNINLFLRSLLFNLVVMVATIIWAPTCLLSAPFPYPQRYWWTARWNVTVIWAARVICGIQYQVRGMENLPDAPAVVLSKHQSAWETIFYILVMPRPLVYVFKKALTYIPFFGWGIALLRMIPIDRSKGKDAMKQVIEIGRQRLADGQWIMMFPEGTRAPVGGQMKYKIGGPLLAVETQTLVVPVAMNSGEYWPKNSFLKRPGTITVSIGKPISPAGKSAMQLLQEVENWIESEMRAISPHVYAQATAARPSELDPSAT